MADSTETQGHNAEPATAAIGHQCYSPSGVWCRLRRRHLQCAILECHSVAPRLPKCLRVCVRPVRPVHYACAHVYLTVAKREAEWDGAVCCVRGYKAAEHSDGDGCGRHLVIHDLIIFLFTNIAG